MTNNQTSIKRNMIMNGLLTMSSIVFPLITFPYISRVILPEGTGKIQFALSVSTYFAMFAQLGIPTYGVRACAKVREDKEKLSRVVHELLTINLFLTILVYILYVASILLVPRLRSEAVLFLIMGLTIFLNSIGVEWLYKALEQYTYITVRSVIFKLVALIATFLLVKNPDDYIIYGAISIFAASASNILNFINLRKYIFFKPLGGYRYREHLQMTMVFFAMAVATTIYTNLDNVMLGFISGDEEVGYYTAAVKVKGILVSLVTSASTVLLPRASAYVDSDNMDDFYKILSKTMHLVILMACPCTAFFMIYSSESILILSGSAFRNAIPVMIYIMPTLLFIGITNVIGIQMLVPLGKEKQVLYSVIVGAVVDLIINILLIPSWGAVGAAVGTTVAELAVLIYQFYVVRNELPILFGHICVGKTFVSLVAAIIVGSIIHCIIDNVIIALILGVIIFYGIFVVVELLLQDSLMKEIVGGYIQKYLGRFLKKTH